ncbi:hypothetical protein [Sphingobium cupriresistens]|uniref:hypothetical protein n=1 Tax=Sphingobium cupriresistens TaxID=1132417 RepID=UPI003BADC844
MLIESIIRRKNGTKVDLDGVSYHFRPSEDDDRHTDDVDNQGHIAALLAIKEGFRPADGSAILANALAETIEGPFFIVRGPQDMQAFADWIRSIPDMKGEPAEFVLLVDKIAVGEASLAGFPLVPKPTVPFDIPPLSSVARAADAPPAAGHSPQPQAANTILPDQSQQASPGSDAGGTQAAGDGGAGAAGGAGADTAQQDAGEEGEKGDDGDQGDGSEGQELDREKLAMEYADIKGHRPNGKWSAEKIAAAIAELKE